MYIYIFVYILETNCYTFSKILKIPKKKSMHNNSCGEMYAHR